jgi:hypothetical protein
MSESLPENLFSGTVRVVKLISGEEIIGFVLEAGQEKIAMKYPARLDSYMMKGKKGEYEEYIKLTNYLSNIKGFEISLSRDKILFLGHPMNELEKMYEIYVLAMQNDPKSLVSSLPDNVDVAGTETGLQLLNDLFNNDEFVNFVNELIENFEGVDIGDSDDESVAESIISDPEEEEPEPQPKKKKRKVVKPETNKLPYNPDSPPDKPESWPDNPMDYLE